MGVYIKGMEMPKENDYTIAIVYGDGVVTEYHEDYWIRGADGEKQLGIAIPVPPHGDLIDRDALKETIEALIEKHLHGYTKSTWDFVCELRRIISDAPTIIPEEEGET